MSDRAGIIWTARKASRRGGNRPGHGNEGMSFDAGRPYRFGPTETDDLRPESSAVGLADDGTVGMGCWPVRGRRIHLVLEWEGPPLSRPAAQDGGLGRPGKTRRPRSFSKWDSDGQARWEPSEASLRLGSESWRRGASSTPGNAALDGPTTRRASPGSPCAACRQPWSRPECRALSQRPRDDRREHLHRPERAYAVPPLQEGRR